MSVTYHSIGVDTYNSIGVDTSQSLGSLHPSLPATHHYFSPSLQTFPARWNFNLSVEEILLDIQINKMTSFSYICQ